MIFRVINKFKYLWIPSTRYRLAQDHPLTFYLHIRWLILTYVVHRGFLSTVEITYIYNERFLILMNNQMINRFYSIVLFFLFFLIYSWASFLRADSQFIFANLDTKFCGGFIFIRFFPFSKLRGVLVFDNDNTKFIDQHLKPAVWSPLSCMHIT